MKLSRFLFRIALRALPAPLRARRGPEMEKLFRENYLAARRVGVLPAASTTVSSMLDAVTFGISQRSRGSRTRKYDLGPRRSTMMALEAMRHDLKFSIRSLRKSPRYTLMAATTLALGIGANASIFSVVNGVMLRPLPFREPHRVVHMGWQYESVFSGWMTAWQFEFWRDNTDVFSAVTTYHDFASPVGSGERGPTVHGLRVSHQFLDVIGMPPILGRGFVPTDDEPGAPDVIVIGARVWRDQFAESMDVIGKTLVVGNVPRTVIGVLSPEFDFPQSPENTDALVPLSLRADPLDEGENYQFLARLRDGVTLEAADAQVRNVTNVFAEAYPDLVLGTTMRLSSYQEIFVGGLRSSLTILMTAIGLVLLIACVNVASLNLTRASKRARELAVRTALGATPKRIAAQVLCESLIVTGLGGAISLAIAPWATNAVLAMAPAQLPRLDRVTLDWMILIFAFGITVIAGLAVGTVGAWSSTRRAVADTLRAGDRGNTGDGRSLQTLLAVEAGVSMVLLVGAGLLISTLREIYRVDPGFERDGLYTARFEGALLGYDDAAAVAELERQVAARLSEHPTIAVVAGASSLPLERGINIPVTIAGRPDDYEGAVEWRGVSEDYIDALGASVIRGRDFIPADHVAGTSPVAIINESFAARYFPDEDPLGQRLEIGKFRGRYFHPDFELPAAEIVGVVADVRDMSLKSDPRRTILVPHRNTPAMLLSPPVFLIRSNGSVDPTNAIRTAIANVDPNLPPVLVRPMDDVMAASLAKERFNVTLMSTFAGLALLLTVVGIYGVVAYDVRKRSREFRIRLALGARVGNVILLSMRRGVAPVMLGLAAGTAATLALSRLIDNLLWGVSPTDAFTIGMVALILTAAAAAASYVPARSAAAGDPRVALE